MCVWRRVQMCKVSVWLLANIKMDWPATKWSGLGARRWMGLWRPPLWVKILLCLRARAQAGCLWDQGKNVYWECVWGRFVTATALSLRPWGLICPDARNWVGWEQRAATGQTGVCICHLVHMHMHIFTLLDSHPAQPERGGGWGHWYCWCSCECSVCLPCNL